jgi:single-stranded-DNA-specific exonuclease
LAVAPEIRAKIPVGWEKWLLDMAGLATIADMVPLVGENRVIATFGLKVLRKSPRIGLQKLCRVTRVNQSKIEEGDVAFMLAPRVNAASRMGNPRDAFQLFITHDEDEADMLAKKLDAANRGRRASAAAITRAVHEKIEARKERGEVLPTVIALGDPDWKPALLGLVASGIAEEYERPVFLWGREANQKLKGSCRTYGEVHVVELMGHTENVFAEFGGHAYSAGFTLKDDRVFFLEEELVKAHALLPETNADASARADLAITPEEATLQLLSKLERLAPFGEGNPKPMFLLRDILLTQVAWFGKANEHLKITIAFPNGSIEAISFYAKRELGKKLDKLAPNACVTLLANLERDQFSRRNVPRLRIVSVA